MAQYRAVFDELVERSRSLTESQDGFNLAPDEQGRPIPGRLHKLQGVGVVDERVLELAREPEILDRVESLMGPNMDVFGTKFYPMLVHGATSTGWHQDNHYFGTNSERVVSCAIYLEATDRENGCLQVVPGSHRTGDLVAHQAGDGVYAHGAWTEVDEAPGGGRRSARRDGGPLLRQPAARRPAQPQPPDELPDRLALHPRRSEPGDVSPRRIQGSAYRARLMNRSAACFSLRPFGETDLEADYHLLHVLSNLQAPQDPDGNREWLQPPGFR